MADDTEPHPYAVPEETAKLAPNAQMTFFPWKGGKGSSCVGRAPSANILEGDDADVNRAGAPS